jgi:sugar lactone lactonase YvrE
MARTWLALLTASLLAAVAPALGSHGTISTLAGGGPDQVPALEASIGEPDWVMVDPSGNIYISSHNWMSVLRVDGLGMLTRYAGAGAIGQPRAAGGPASSTVLPSNQTVMDQAGNLLIAVPVACQIMRVDSVTGIVTAIAGNGSCTSSGDGGPATSASFVPNGLAIDGRGNLLLTDTGGGGSRVRRVDAVTGMITTYAGGGTSGYGGDGGPATSARLNSPDALGLDSSGNLYIADFGNWRVRRVDAATRIITTHAGTGSYTGFSGDGIPATSASIGLWGIAVGPSGDVFIADSRSASLSVPPFTFYPPSFRVRKVDATTHLISTIAGNGLGGYSGDGGPATSAGMNPRRIALDSFGNLFIGDPGAARIRRVDAATGVITTVAGNGNSGFSEDGEFAMSVSMSPVDVVKDVGGNLYIADQRPSTAFWSNRILRTDAATGITTVVAGGGTAGSCEGIPATTCDIRVRGLAMDSSGNLYFSDVAHGDRIRKVSLTTGIITTYAGGGAPTPPGIGDGGPATSARLNVPRGLAFDSTGALFIADERNHRIRRVGVEGNITTVAGTGTPGPLGDGGPATSAYLEYPADVALDPAGNLLISDTNHFRIRRVDRVSGIITTVAGTSVSGFSGDGGPATAASLGTTRGIAVDAAGNLYIADASTAAERIRFVDSATGIISTIAGNGIRGLGGDGGPASLASLCDPEGITIDGNGNLIIADYNNSRIRQVAGQARVHLSLTPSMLWPPNHRMVDVATSLTGTAACASPAASLRSVESNEPDDASGNSDGDTTDDVQDADIGTSDLQFSLRAERDSHGGGRVYSVFYDVTCAPGDVVEAAAVVVVSHDQGGVTDPVRIDVTEHPGGTYIEWAAVPGASTYDVVRGNLGGVFETANEIELGSVTCIQSGSVATNTSANLDGSIPSPGEAFLYLVQYRDPAPTSYGAENARKPRVPTSGGCP